MMRHTVGVVPKAFSSIGKILSALNPKQRQISQEGVYEIISTINRIDCKYIKNLKIKKKKINEHSIACLRI